MNTPFFDKIKLLSKTKTRFFVPGHKGNPSAIPPFADILLFDITEIDGADDLQHPTDTLLKSQQNMANVYNVGASVYSAHGCTSCIEAMLATFLNMGDTVIMARNSHVSAVRTVAFLDLNPVWVIPSVENELDIQQVESLIQKTHPKAVYLTSPNYYGYISNITECAKLCKQYGIPLLVDNAHGAHLKFLNTDLHPITLGATACADSVHKTLPCLTGAAVLQLADITFAERARWAVNMFSSTSPSYLILSSIDLACGALLQGDIDFATAEHRCNITKIKLKNICISGGITDPLKITLAPYKTGYTTEQVVSVFRRNNIEPEMTDDFFIVLMASAFNTQKDFDVLVECCTPFLTGQETILPSTKIQIPVKKMSVRTATFSQKKQIETIHCVGKIAAGIITPCPPGIPVIMPGEVIGEQQMENIINTGILLIDVVQ